MKTLLLAIAIVLTGCTKLQDNTPKRMYITGNNNLKDVTIITEEGTYHFDFWNNIPEGEIMVKNNQTVYYSVTGMGNIEFFEPNYGMIIHSKFLNEEKSGSFKWRVK